jgi:hypothetical protein
MAVVGVVIFVLWIVDLTGLLSNGDAYGRLDIPGTKVFHFPKRVIEISFETQLQSASGGGGLVVPALSLSVERADGRGPDPSVVQSFGSSTSVNGDAHRRVWKMTITQAGDYRVMASGEVGPYIDPQLTFGHTASFGPSFEIGLLALAGLLAVSLVAGRIAGRAGGSTLAADAGSAGTPSAVQGAGSSGALGGVPGASAGARGPRSPRPPEVAGPTREDVVLARLDKLADLHERGALTAAEFAAEKARILGTD